MDTTCQYYTCVLPPVFAWRADLEILPDELNELKSAPTALLIPYAINSCKKYMGDRK